MVIGVLFATMLSLVSVADGIIGSQRKLLMIGQIIMPLAGLVLGQLIDDTDKIIARGFLWVITIVVPLQLLATWVQGGLILTHYLYAFSIYAHFQYVSLIFVCAYAYCLSNLWEEHRIWLGVLLLPMTIYVTAGLSFLTIFAFVAVVLGFYVSKLCVYRKKFKFVLISASLLAVVAAGGFSYFENMYGHRASVEGEHGLFHRKFKALADGKIPSNVEERFGDWRLFGGAIVESGHTLVFGHAQPMPRETRSSPHNWYLDTAYTFGLLGLLPLFLLIGYTAHLSWRGRGALTPEVWWLLSIVAYLVVIDSNFKVTLRQPYPGIFAYFLWGLLLSRLRALSQKKIGA